VRLQCEAVYASHLQGQGMKVTSKRVKTSETRGVCAQQHSLVHDVARFLNIDTNRVQFKGVGHFVEENGRGNYCELGALESGPCCEMCSSPPSCRSLGSKS
jgi:hypothetical protein